MECELCNNEYDSQKTVPKILKSCAHTYCNSCLKLHKQMNGNIFCPQCAIESKSFLSAPSRKKGKDILAPSQVIANQNQQAQDLLNSVEANQERQQVQQDNQSLSNSVISYSKIDPDSLPINQKLLQLIEFRHNEKLAIQKMKSYQIQNPKSFTKIEETVTRQFRPYQINLSEITQDELIYHETVQNLYLDKRTLNSSTYPYRTYVFNQNSVFINYFFLTEYTRMLFLFRRLNGCQHKHSCVESVMRKIFDVVSAYAIMRVPIKALVEKLSRDKQENFMEQKWFYAFEMTFILVFGALRSAGCFVRFLDEEIIQQS